MTVGDVSFSVLFAGRNPEEWTRHVTIKASDYETTSGARAFTEAEYAAKQQALKVAKAIVTKDLAPLAVKVVREEVLYLHET